MVAPAAGVQHRAARFSRPPSPHEREERKIGDSRFRVIRY
jgi:hypothetical protein